MDRKVFNNIENDEKQAYKVSKSIILNNFKFSIFIFVFISLIALIELISVIGDTKKIIIGFTLFGGYSINSIIFAFSLRSFYGSDDYDYYVDVKIYKMLKHCKPINIGQNDLDNVLKKIFYKGYKYCNKKNNESIE